jgi:hypothetical protein
MPAMADPPTLGIPRAVKAGVAWARAVMPIQVSALHMLHTLTDSIQQMTDEQDWAALPTAATTKNPHTAA